MQKLNVILSLRRDNDYNYAKIKNTFIPANGEVCLVDTATSGLRAVCGDGRTPFGQLEYVDSIFAFGVYSNNAFYHDDTKLQDSTNKLYVDTKSKRIYYFDGINYQFIGGNTPTATAETAGAVKLYSTTGYNTDGTMTQKSITDELNSKVEISLNASEELIIFK